MVMVMAHIRTLSVSRWVLVGCLIVLLPLSDQMMAAKSRFSGIVVFGTSFSDSGNAFVLLGEAGTPPDYSIGPFDIPTLPYARGGHHLSNGATWIEQFARPLGLAGSVRPALQGGANATNFAVGAARAREDNINFNLARQVDTFFLQSGGVAAPDALYVIEMGANDVRDAFIIFGSAVTAAWSFRRHCCQSVRISNGCTPRARASFSCGTSPTPRLHLPSGPWVCSRRCWPHS